MLRPEGFTLGERIVDKAWERYVDLVTGFAQVTQRRAEQVTRALVRRGEIEANKGERTVEDLLARVNQNRRAISSIVKSEMEETVRRLGLARQSDIDRLQAKITRLEAAIRGEAQPPEPPARGEPIAEARTPPEPPAPFEPPERVPPRVEADRAPGV